MSAPATVNIYRDAPEIVQTFIAAQNAISEAVEPRLRHLLTLRASQINGCAFCIRMHVKEALDDGDSHDRLHRLSAWRHMSDFTPSEKAALAWVEALTVIDPAADLAPLRMALREHFDDRQIAGITAQVAMINLWNRTQIAGH